MSLRTRMVLVAGVAVAIAVVAVAVASYEGTRSELQGQVDQSLRSLIKTPLSRIGLGPRGARSPLPQSGRRIPRQPGDGDNDSRDADAGLGIDQLPPQAFGGASGVSARAPDSSSICAFRNAR